MENFAADNTRINSLSYRLTPSSLLRGNCPICNTESYRLWSDKIWSLPFSKDRFGLAECSKCNTIFSSPRPTSAQLVRFYRDFYNYHWFEQHFLFKKVQGWHRWRRIQPLLKKYGLHNGRLLDIGCGHGLFLLWAKRNGWDVTGIDYPSAATKYANQKLGIHIVEADFVDVHYDRLGSFDLITLWHCLEHSIDPLFFISHIVELLKPSAKVLIAVPNGASPGMRLKKEKWIWCQEPFVHTVHFTPKSLNMLVEKAGLRCLSIWSRDTWDANRLFDIYLYISIWKIASKLKRISWRIGFYFEEGCRLTCYVVGGFKHWCLGLESLPGVGSELLLLAEKIT